MRVALLPTGRTEWHGLAIALQRLFRAHEFYALPEPTVFHSMRGPFNGFTSSTLTERHEREYLPESALELVGLAAREALGDGAHREAADDVVVIDDLELANRHQPDRAVRVFRRAVEHHLEGLQGTRKRTETALRERVSFHLVVPMIEAWFFGDPQALRRAGVPDGVKPVPQQRRPRGLPHDNRHVVRERDRSSLPVLGRAGQEEGRLPQVARAPPARTPPQGLPPVALPRWEREELHDV